MTRRIACEPDPDEPTGSDCPCCTPVPLKPPREDKQRPVKRNMKKDR